MSECPGKSVGAIIKKIEGDVLKFLLIDRVNEPHGWAGVAGHLDEGKTSEKMIEIEIAEEVGFTGLKTRAKVFKQMVPWNYCWRNKDRGHYWEVFDYHEESYGIVKIEPDEVKGFGWFTVEEMEHLNLEGVWRHIFEELGYIPKYKQAEISENAQPGFGGIPLTKPYGLDGGVYVERSSCCNEPVYYGKGGVKFRICSKCEQVDEPETKI